MINETPVTTTAEAVRLISVVMADDPTELKKEGIMTVYKHPRTTVLSVSKIAVASQHSQHPSLLFSHAASKGYFVEISVPEDCYDEVLQSLKNEPLITQIDGVITESGQIIENSISEMMYSRDR